MIDIILFFSKYSSWVYLILIIGLLVALRSFLLSIREQRDLVFGLEREITHRRVVQSSTGLIILGLILIAEFTLVTFLTPVLPGSSMITTPTISFLTNSQGTVVPGLETTTSGTPVTTSTLMPVTGCIQGQIMITDPKTGQEIQGKITITGTVDIPNFGFYKYEFSPQGTETWSTITAGNKAVIGGELGFWDTTEVAAGDYQLRLVVSDNNGMELPACIIQLRVTK
jgi:hypothetical protein